MRQMKRIHLTEADWLKLRDYNKRISKRIQAKLPADWPLSGDEIESAVYDTILKLLATYKDGAMSATSYVWQYAETYTLRDLLREYKTLKSQLDIYDLLDPDEKDGNTHHAYGRADVQAMTVDYRDAADSQMDARAILDKATPDDKAIMLDIMAGKSYAEIAAERGIDKMAITRRMKKYMEVA